MKSEEEKDAKPAETLYEIVNVKSISMTLASFCIVKQSWHCFAQLMESLGLDELKKTIQIDTYGAFTKSKVAKDYADETELSSEYEQIIAWFEIYRDQTPKNEQLREKCGNITVDQIIETIEQTLQETQTTYIVTDEKCV